MLQHCQRRLAPASAIFCFKINIELADWFKRTWNRPTNGTTPAKLVNASKLNLFICSKVMFLHCLWPVEPSSKDLWFQSNLYKVKWSQRTRNYIMCTVIMYWDCFWPPHGKYGASEDKVYYEKRASRKRKKKNISYTKKLTPFN